MILLKLLKRKNFLAVRYFAILAVIHFGGISLWVDNWLSAYHPSNAYRGKLDAVFLSLVSAALALHIMALFYRRWHDRRWPPPLEFFQAYFGWLFWLFTWTFMLTVGTLILFVVTQWVQPDPVPVLD